MKHPTIIILLSVFISSFADAQAKYKGLKVGDTVPNVSLNRIVNYVQDKAMLNDFKGKLVILDFWSKGCKACVASMPKMEKLQHQFGDRIQIFLVNYYNPWASLNDPYFPKSSRSSIIKNTTLPFVFDSQDLNSLFPHGGEPYHVWIDKNGIIKAMTNGYNATPERIQDLLDGKNVQLSNSNSKENIPHQSIFLEKGTQYTTIKYYSLIGTYLPSAPDNSAETIIDPSNDIHVGEKFTNCSIRELFMKAFRCPPDRIVLELPNADNYFRPIDPNKIDVWKAKNLYSYEVIVLPYEKWNEIMKRDLESYFDIHPRKEKRSLQCWVVRTTTNENRLRTMHPKDDIFVEHTDNFYSLRNAPFGRFMEYLISRNIMGNLSKALPIVDETGYDTVNVDMEIRTALDDIPALNKKLNRYGVEIVKSYRQLEVLVLY